MKPTQELLGSRRAWGCMYRASFYNTFQTLCTYQMVCVCMAQNMATIQDSSDHPRALLLCFSPLCCQLLSGTCRDGTYFQLPEPLRSAPPGTFGLLARPQFRAPKLRRQKPIVAEKAVSASATCSRTTIDLASSSRSLLLSPASACTSLCMHSPTSLGRLSPHPRPGVRVASSSDSWRAATRTPESPQASSPLQSGAPAFVGISSLRAKPLALCVAHELCHGQDVF